MRAGNGVTGTGTEEHTLFPLSCVTSWRPVGFGIDHSECSYLASASANILCFFAHYILLLVGKVVYSLIRPVEESLRWRHLQKNAASSISFPIFVHTFNISFLRYANKKQL